MSEACWQAVGEAGDFLEGEGVAVSIGPRRIAIFRDQGRLYALKDLCPHRGDSLSRLAPCDGRARCIGHGWQFDLASGRCVRGEPGARVATYPVRERQGQVEVDIG